ncbi:unnamed protein product [Parnassius apollo]|uniref:(apollo) hypothetical protein n=1 Tax=Parnassius apollo TaxID=110799 RepID=A0A8S3WSD4_PARAO|nr:unnamed protein product [Parnassius apollo]
MEENHQASIPKTALNLYVRLYCKKRKLLENTVTRRHTTLVEATKSWLSLSKSEREIFVTKYNNIVNEYKKKIANSLKDAKPYLKKKDLKRYEKTASIHTENHGNQDKQQNSEVNFNKNILEDSKPIIGAISTNDGMTSELDFAESQENEIPDNNSFGPEYLPEPIPPRFTSGKELYEMLMLRTKEETVNWNSLSVLEKRRYHNAILCIKRNYIKSYKSFLESLTPEELFNYYVKNKHEE